MAQDAKRARTAAAMLVRAEALELHGHVGLHSSVVTESDRGKVKSLIMFTYIQEATSAARVSSVPCRAPCRAAARAGMRDAVQARAPRREGVACGLWRGRCRSWVASRGESRSRTARRGMR